MPFPFARAALIFGEPIIIPADAKTDEEQRHWAEQVGAAINALEAEAERLVGAVPTADGAWQDEKKEWRRA